MRCYLPSWLSSPAGRRGGRPAPVSGPGASGEPRGQPGEAGGAGEAGGTGRRTEPPPVKYAARLAPSGRRPGVLLRLPWLAGALSVISFPATVGPRSVLGCIGPQRRGRHRGRAIP